MRGQPNDWTTAKRYATHRAILALCENEALTAEELAEHVNVTAHSVRRAIVLIRERSPGLLHIADWHQNIGVSGNWAAKYKVGDAPDKREPSKKKSVREARARHYAKYRQLYRSRYWAKKGAPANPFAHMLMEAAR